MSNATIIDYSEGEQLYADQVEQVFSHQASSTLANLVNSCILAFVQWKVVPHAAVVTWLLSFFLITLLRHGLYITYRRSPKTPAQAKRWGGLFIVGLAVSGLAWGSTALFLFPADSTAHQIFTAFILGGMVAGAAASASAIRNAFYAYCIPALSPIIIKLFSIGGDIHVSMAVMALVFAFFSIATSYHIHRIIFTSLRLRFENKLEIQERRKAEKELKLHQEHLESLIENRTAELSDSNKRLLSEIAERRKAEERLQLFRNLIDQSNDAIFVIDPETGLFLDCNHAASSSLGYDQEELLAKGVMDIDVSFPDTAAWRDILAQTRKKGSIIVEGRHKRRDGPMFPVEVNAKFLTLDNKNFIVAVARDITSRVEAEEALRKSEQRYSNLFQYSSDGIIVHDLNGAIIDINQKTLEQFGYTKDEMLALTIQELHPRDMLEKAGQAFQEVSRTGFAGFEIDFRKKDSAVFPAEVSASLFEMGDKKIVQGLIRDITVRKQLESELLKAHKLESVGILAGGIAHDFNNLLTSILGNVSLAKMSAKPGEAIFKLLDATEKSVTRAKGLTQQLLTFSKGGAPVRVTASVAELLKDSTAFTLSGTNVKSDFAIPDGLWPVKIDEGQISQVIQNLVTNAAQAMPGGGTVSVSAQNVFIEKTADLALEKGQYIKISIRDEGEGVPEKHLSNIFDPYFTTKEKGNGLGLAICYSIIKNHQGLITVDSKQGEGATFHIHLPASVKKAIPVGEAATEVVPGKGMILLMDDEQIVRDVAVKMLSRIGYQVEVAGNGLEAVNLYKKAKDSGRPYDAVIMDLTVPGGMGGKEAVEKLLEIDPCVKAVVSSGYANDPIMADYRRYGFCGVIPKPYDLNGLGATLHAVIRGEKAPASRKTAHGA